MDYELYRLKYCIEDDDYALQEEALKNIIQIAVSKLKILRLMKEGDLQ